MHETRTVIGYDHSGSQNFEFLFQYLFVSWFISWECNAPVWCRSTAEHENPFRWRRDGKENRIIRIMASRNVPNMIDMFSSVYGEANRRVKNGIKIDWMRMLRRCHSICCRSLIWWWWWHISKSTHADTASKHTHKRVKCRPLKLKHHRSLWYIYEFVERSRNYSNMLELIWFWHSFLLSLSHTHTHVSFIAAAAVLIYVVANIANNIHSIKFIWSLSPHFKTILLHCNTFLVDFSLLLLLLVLH